MYKMKNYVITPPILTIAGSDSGGGAGIQADLKTIQALGGYGMSAITAITAQNTQGVFGVQEVSTQIIKQQIELVLSDIGTAAIKTGMLASAEIIEVVASTIAPYIQHISPAACETAPFIPPACGGGRGGGGFGVSPTSTRDLFTMERAKDLRRQQTKEEYKLWEILSARKLEGYKFRRQQAIGEYIVDFINMKTGLIIELDGGQHDELTREDDHKRTAWLEKNGYRVLRFWNNEVLENIEGVVERILSVLRSYQSPPPLRPPQAGGIKSASLPVEGAKDVRSNNTFLIIDPVMVAKGGASLLADDAIDALITKFLPLASVVTPNIPEAEKLSGITILNKEDMLRAAEAILAHGVQAVVVKGGHLESGDGLVHNLLMSREGLELWQSSPRIHTRNTHGTGCTFSAAMATLLGRGFSLQEAFMKAEEYVAGAITHAPDLGQGHGPLGHGFMHSAFIDR
jgi:hydroxymethylpyrimidine kinase/phosphomethylpyrimidine kinase